MDHDENISILSYYILDMIPGCASELQQRQRLTATVQARDIISLPKATNSGRTSPNTASTVTSKDEQLSSSSSSSKNHLKNLELDTERVIPWVVDEWTVHDEQEATQMLADQMEQCRITDQDYKTKKFRINDTMAWNRFYQSHQSNFFKDRHYFVKEFPQEFTLSGDDIDATLSTTGTPDISRAPPSAAPTTIMKVQHRCLVEIGCGVGNAMLPLLGSDRCSEYATHDTGPNEMKPEPLEAPIQWTVYGFDLSSTAIDILRNDVRYQQALKVNRTYCDVCDISIPNVMPPYARSVADVTSLIFCLSAIHPTKHSIVMQNVISTLQPGKGTLIFRDYGRYDLAQIKLGTQRSKLLDNDNFYRKHDGTKCYYFTIEDMEDLVQQQKGALEILELRYIRRKYVNRSMQCERRRVWVQGRFRRTMQSIDCK